MTAPTRRPPRRRPAAVPGVDLVAQTCAALADPIRLRILALLQQGEVCVCDIHGSLDVPQPTASRHLAYLRRHGLVVGRKDGLWVHYRVADALPATLRAGHQHTARVRLSVPAAARPLHSGIRGPYPTLLRTAFSTSSALDLARVWFGTSV